MLARDLRRRSLRKEGISDAIQVISGEEEVRIIASNEEHSSRGIRKTDADADADADGAKRK